MSTARELKRRLQSVTGTYQMTQAMRMVSASKYNRALAMYRAYKPYQEQCERLSVAIGANAVTPREVRRVLYVAVTGNRGLCGACNHEVITELKNRLKEQTLPYDVMVCGKWGIENCDIPFTPYVIADIPTREQATELCHKLRKLYEDGEADEIYFVSQRFRNVLTRTPETRLFMPQKHEQEQLRADYIFEPSKAAITEAVGRQALTGDVWETLLSAAASVQSAMMMTMRTASDNSEKLMDDLSLKLNRMRQSSVTTQVLEVASATVRED